MAERVLWVTPVADVGGVARHVLDVARAGIPGCEVVVVSPEGPLADSLAEAGLAHITAEIGPRFGMARTVEVLRSIWRRLDPAVVHTHLAFADLAGVAALPRGFRGRTALVSTEHGIATSGYRYQANAGKAAAMAAAHTARLRQSDAAIAVCEATRTAMQQQWRARHVTVIRNGIDPAGNARADSATATHAAGRVSRNERVETTPASSTIRVGTLARLAPEKRLDALVRGFAEVAAHHGAHLSIGGDGPERHRLEALVAHLGLTDRVDLPGVVDSDALLAEIDVFALTSATENCSYAMLDAMHHGLGICASPVGGNLEIVPSHCLADPVDPTALATVLVDQAHNPARRPHLPVHWPTVAQMTEQIAEVYASCR